MIISVISAKGGVGKTFFCANISAKLSSNKNKTVVVDFNNGFRNLDIALGLENQITYTLDDVFSGKYTIDEVIFEDTGYDNLHFIPASQNINPVIYLETAEKLLKQLNDMYDYVVIDCMTSFNGVVKHILSISDQILVVTTPDIISVRNTDVIINSIDVDKVKLIINKIPIEKTFPMHLMNADEIIDNLQVKLCGIINSEDCVEKSLLTGRLAIFDNDVLNSVFTNIAIRISGKEVPIYKFQYKKPNKSFKLFK